jgi:ABC-type multidrug transport system ATPase subunit
MEKTLAIETHALRKEFGKYAAVRGLDLQVERGEVFGFLGPNGAGKTTSIKMLLGLVKPTSGSASLLGKPITDRSAREKAGFLPEHFRFHDWLSGKEFLVLHGQLYGMDRLTLEKRSEELLDLVGLTPFQNNQLRTYSKGMLQRIGLAQALLNYPELVFLDEPTSGLDPSTAADVMRLLRRLSQRGVTVVLTTHEPAGIDRCDRVVFLARDGHLAFTGSPSDARRYFGVNDIAGVYVRLAGEDTPEVWAKRFADSRWTLDDRPGKHRLRLPASRRNGQPVSVIRQWWLLTQRNMDVLCRNRLTLAVLLGSPVLVTVMMATLFNRGAFDTAADLGPTQIVFWIAFAGFFFGLTYGLLQIVGELAVFRRERLAGLSVTAYVASKVASLLPVLAGVSAVLLGVLRILGRLPAVGWHVYGLLFGTIVIEATSALALGLFASAAVSNAAQAALALPMLCFPQVLFGGAIVPVDRMAIPGRLMSAVLANRHAFEALGRDLHLDHYTATLPAMSAYGNTFHGGTQVSLVALASFAAALTLATIWVLDRRSRPGTIRR